jgi:hypothetical protein
MSKRSDAMDAPTKKELRDFGLVLGAIVAVLFGLALPWFLGHEYPRWPWVVAGVLWVWALSFPTTLGPVHRGWMAIGHLLGWLNTRIILGIMFFVIFLPVGMVMKLVGKDPMARQQLKDLSSYRVKSQSLARNHVERPY